MPEGVNRKACDRCHKQKLSCNRVGEEACERCIRGRTACTSSPSLRYKKGKRQEALKLPTSAGSAHAQSQRRVDDEGERHMVRQQSMPQLNHRYHRHAQQEHHPPAVSQPTGTQFDMNSLGNNISLEPGITMPQTFLPDADSIDQRGRRTPKRRRTASELGGAVQPEPAPAVPIVPDPLDIPLGFGIEPLAYFTEPRPEYLTHPSSLDTISQLQVSNTQFPLSWGADPVTIHQSFSEPQPEPQQHLVPGSASDAYSQVVPAPFPILDQSIAARVNPSESSTPSSNSFVPIWNTLSSELLVGHPEPLLLSSTAESGARVSSPIASSNPLFQVLVELGHPPPVPDRLTEIFAEISLPSHWMSKLNDLCRRMLGMSVHLRELEGEGPKNWLNREHVDFPIEALLTTMNEFYVTIETSLAGAQEAQEEHGDQNNQICWFDKDDENNIRLVVSVYDRIIDILRRLFALAREEHDNAPDRGVKVLFKRWLQPGVTVGALTLPQFPVVKMAVLTDSVVTILTLLRTATKSFSPAVLDAVSASGPEKMNGSKSSLTDVVDTNFQNLMRKEADLVRFLCDLRDDLTNLLGHHPSAVQYIRDRKAARRI